MPNHYGEKKKKKKKIMHSFKMNFISAVNRPAQEGAQAVLLKRADEEPVENNDESAQVEKFMAISTTDMNHAHLIDNHSQLGGKTDYAFAPGDEMSHAHPFIINYDGDVIIGEVNGHSHGIAQISKDGDLVLGPEIETLNKDEPMTEEEKAQFEAFAKRAERSEAIALLSDVQKAHFTTLKGDEADAFLALGHDERELAIKSLQEDDAVIYTDNDGIEYRKSSDPALVALAKRADKSAAEAKAEKAARLNEQLKKTADEVLKHYPGDDLTKTELCRAIAGIEKEGVRDDIFKMLEANNEAMGKAFDTYGTAEGVDIEKQSPEAQLDSLVAKYAEENTVDEITAYNKVLDTPKGQELYGQLYS